MFQSTTSSLLGTIALGTLQFKAMPATVFTAEIEQKLMEIWADLLYSLDKHMVTRLDKEQKALDALNEYAKTIGHPRMFVLREIGDKIDTLRKKGRAMYDQFRKMTSTGSEVVDVEAACQAWESFDVYHRVFAAHPTWGVGKCQDTGKLSTVSPSSRQPTTSASAQQPQMAASSADNVPVRTQSQTTVSDTDTTPWQRHPGGVGAGIIEPSTPITRHSPTVPMKTKGREKRCPELTVALSRGISSNGSMSLRLRRA